MSPLGLLNFLVLQWFGIRLCRRYMDASGLMFEDFRVGDRLAQVSSDGHRGQWRIVAQHDGVHVVLMQYGLLHWVWPLTGWWSDFVYLNKRSLVRALQITTNVHRIHHIQYAYGWTFRPIPWAYFPPFKLRDSDVPGGWRRLYYGWKRVKPSGFHDCTWTGRY